MTEIKNAIQISMSKLENLIRIRESPLGYDPEYTDDRIQQILLEFLDMIGADALSEKVVETIRRTR